MKLYTMDGHSFRDNTKGKLIGKLDIIHIGINHEEFFDNSIIDYLSNPKEQAVKGMIDNNGDLTELLFLEFPLKENLKSPKKADLASWFYKVRKPRTEDFSGKYTGQWYKLPSTVDIKEDLKKIFSEIDTEVCGSYGLTVINLYRI